MLNEQILENLRNNILLTINTCFPAIVESFNTNDGTATIRPMFKIKYYGQEARALPIITGVPTLKQQYIVNGGTEQTYRMVLRPGNVVLCVCAQRSLDDVDTKQVYYAGKSRVLDIQDAVIVGVLL